VPRGVGEGGGKRGGDEVGGDRQWHGNDGRARGPAQEERGAGPGERKEVGLALNE
jgi:hypothetical protein